MGGRYTATHEFHGGSASTGVSSLVRSARGGAASVVVSVAVTVFAGAACVATHATGSGRARLLLLLEGGGHNLW